MYKKSCLESDRAVLSQGPTPFCNLLLMLKTEANVMCIGQESIDVRNSWSVVHLWLDWQLTCSLSVYRSGARP